MPKMNNMATWVVDPQVEVVDGCTAGNVLGDVVNGVVHEDIDYRDWTVQTLAQGVQDDISGKKTSDHKCPANLNSISISVFQFLHVTIYIFFN